MTEHGGLKEQMLSLGSVREELGVKATVTW